MEVFFMNQSNIYAIARQQFDRAGAYMIKSAMPMMSKLVTSAQLSNNQTAEQIRGFYLHCKRSGKNRFLGTKTDELITTCEAVYINPLDINKTTELGQMSSQQLYYYVMCLSRMVDASKPMKAVEYIHLPVTEKIPRKTQPQNNKTDNAKPDWMIDLRHLSGMDVLKIRAALEKKDKSAAQYVQQTFAAECTDPRKMRSLSSTQKSIIDQARQVLNKK